jgi:hypothetical protein
MQELYTNYEHYFDEIVKNFEKEKKQVAGEEGIQELYKN